MNAPFRVLAAALLLAAAAAPGCGRLPRIVVLTDPLSADEHVDLGLAYERKGELDLAGREYERALRKDGRHFRARVNLGNVRVAEKRYEEARREYLEALGIRPKDPEATNNLAWTAVLSGEGMEEALTRLMEAVAAPGGRSPEILDTVGVLRMRTGRPEEAAEALADAERLCLERISAGAGGDAPEARGGTGCREETLREIREHRRELRERFPAPDRPAPLVR